MKKLMKRIAATTLAATMIFSLTACGGSDNSGSSSSSGDTGSTGDTSSAAVDNTASDTSVESASAGDGEDIVIRITWWGGESRHGYTEELLEFYTSEHPNVHFETSPSGWDGYFEKLSTQAASGAMPDIIQMDYLYISSYATNGTLADMTPYINDGTIDVSNIDQSIIGSGVVNGIQAGFPLATSLLAVGYNPGVLEQAGVEVPDSSWTWSDWIEINKQIADATGFLGTTTGPVDDTNMFNYWVRQHGVQLFADDNKSLGFEDDSITAGYFQMWKNMMDEGSAANPDEYDQIATLGTEADPVVTNEAGFKFGWNNYTNNLTGINDDLAMLTPPLADNGGDLGLWVKPGMFFSIAETSEVKDECAEFINWFVNSEEANDIIAGERGTPVSSAIRDYMINSGTMTKQQQQMFSYVDEAVALCSQTPAPDPVGIAEVNQAFKDAAYSAFYGMTSCEDAAATFRSQANEILERNN